MRAPATRLLAAAAFVVVVSACGGAAGSAGRAAGDATTAPAESSSTGAASTGAPGPSTRASSAGVTGGAASSSSRPVATSPSLRTGGSSPSSPSPSPKAVFPPPGHYTYDVSGTATTPLGTQNLAGTSDLTVDPARAGRQHSVDKDANGSTEQTAYARSSGVYLADLHISQQGFDEDFHPVAAALVVPASPRKGQTWSWRMTSTDGRYALSATLTVDDPRGSATVSGRRLRTVVVSGHIVITGAQLHMTIDQRDVVARATPVISEHAVVDGTAYGATFHSDSTRRLRSTTPN